MSYKPIIIILGEPYSVFLEIFLKSYKNFILKKYRVPIILVGSFKLLKNQMRYFGYKFKINILKEEDIESIKNIKKAVKGTDESNFDKLNKLLDEKNINDILGYIFDGTFYNVLIQQLVHATDININSFGNYTPSDVDQSILQSINIETGSKKGVTQEELMTLYNQMNDHKNVSIKELKSTELNNKDTADPLLKRLLSIKSDASDSDSNTSVYQIDHKTRKGEPFTGDSEMDQSFQQVTVLFYNNCKCEDTTCNDDKCSDTEFKSSTKDQKIAFFKQLHTFIGRGDIYRGKGALKDPYDESKLIKIQISNSAIVQSENYLDSNFYAQVDGSGSSSDTPVEQSLSQPTHKNCDKPCCNIKQTTRSSLETPGGGGWAKLSRRGLVNLAC